mmetsp:Transcript_52572/g.57051  ORF Transcript_52572/g.57051 Transcript_52572/m.57051 type:complete len:425 (+) Transcript_52572:44-1318(+)
MGKVTRKAKGKMKDEISQKKLKRDMVQEKIETKITTNNDSDNRKRKKNEQAPEPDDPLSTTSSTSVEEKWSKSKKKRMRKMMYKSKMEKDGRGGNRQIDAMNLMRQGDSSKAIEKNNDVISADIQPTNSTFKMNGSKRNMNSVQKAFKARLAGSRFRILNEELYTTTSKKSYDKFTENPELFEQYHDGFRHQVESWPENPVDVIVGFLTSTYKNSKTTPCVVADFGCGDAQLAKDLFKVKKMQKNVKSKKKKSREEEEGNSDASLFTVYSFDLVSPNQWVTACDMANVPLPDKSVDVCVFCLSLMGTNLADFIREAHRVLKNDGCIKIAEVRSRIEYSHSRKGKSKNNNDDKKHKQSNKIVSTMKDKTEGTLDEFTGVLGKLGFECLRTDRTNTMFLLLELKKNGKMPNKSLEFTAKPCIYKRR